MLPALLGVLAVGGWGSYAVFAASGPPAPTITSSPANPTNQTSASFAFSDTQSNVTFQCSLDGAAFAACAGPKAYAGPLTAASHTFQIKALDNKSNASAATSYTWTIDTTAPTVSSINLASASPTNAASVAWTVTFSESVKNVATGNFSLVNGGLTGPSITGVTGSGASYTVTANTGTGSGSLGLNLSSKGTISDQAGNPLGGTAPVTGQVYTVDKTPPPAPTITSGPTGTVNQSSATVGFSDSESGVTYLCKLDAAAYAACANPATFSGLADGSHTLTVEAKDAAGNVSSPSVSRSWTVDTTPPPKPTIVGPNNKSDSTAATFTISDSEANVTYKCSLDGGAYTPCSSNPTYTLLTPGTHIFDAEPIDQAGNVGPYNEWKWTINGSSGAGQAFTIGNPPLPLLYPGGATDPMNLSLTNPNSVTIYITSLTVALSATPSPSATGPNPCSASLDFTLAQFSGGYPIVLPPGTKTLSQLGYTQAQWPSIKMLDRPLNQDRCKNATLTFTYGGSAQS